MICCVFQWLGPFAPGLMKLVEFNDKPESGAGSREMDKMNGSTNRNENHRIIIVPWPQYTDALKRNSTFEGGNLIDGHVQNTKYGSRIRWKKHKLSDMALGYGGCYVTQKISEKKIRIHTFGGREVAVDIRGQDVRIYKINRIFFSI